MGTPRGRRLIVALLLTLAAGTTVLGGCAPGSSSTAPSLQPGQPSAESAGPVPPPADDPVTSAPPTGETTIDPDGGGGAGGVAVDLPRLPVGGTGSFVDAEQSLQCAPISWTAFGGAAGLDRGVQVEVVGYQFDTTHFALADGGCDEPSCVHFVFGASDAATGCTVAIRTVRPQPAGLVATSLFLVGKARCDDVGAALCQEFIAAVGHAAGDASTIDLVAPDPPSDGPSGSPSESPSPWPTDSPSPVDGTPDPTPTA